MVLNGRNDNVVAFFLFGESHALDGQIIGFGAGGGKYDFRWFGTDEAGDICAGFFD